MQIDDECSVCWCIQSAINNLEQVCLNITLTCQGKKKKKDFGLDQGYIKKQIKQLAQIQKWHQYYHATGEALNDGEIGLPSNNERKPPPRRSKQ